ncbi:MAG: FumA C-terminus/TtdB family hydratase beta subunit [Candidatus Sulfobium sp.]|jgi:tartrate/fumarate subfamily iron-sulfur-dependent hydro-lyase beta chain
MVKALSLPLSREDVSGLKTGDIVSITGRVITGRDRIHRYLFEKRPPGEDIPFDLSGAVIYHCGPVMKKTDSEFLAVAAGPTTSMRVEMFTPEIIRAYGLAGIMGKGGMGDRTLRALREHSCVYFHTIGGAAAFLADRIARTQGAWKLEEFGPTEAMWLFEVKDFPAIVTMDAHGNNMHKEIEEASYGKFLKLTR